MTIPGMHALHDPPPTWPSGRFVRQRFESADRDPSQLAADLADQLRRSARLDALAPGARVGVAVGSRGITNLTLVVRTVIDSLHERGLKPTVLPAMGSHGGATAEGQRALLAGYGITEERVGASVDATMDTESIGRDSGGHDVHLATAALHQVDAVIPINRVKPHTDFRAAVESGLAKMLVIGLGKQPGAEATHALGMPAFATRIPERAAMILDRVHVPFGIALVENARKETSTLSVVPGDRLLEEEAKLLEQATAEMARLPFDAADVVILEQMGKDISGPGCDPNVLGRYLTTGMSGGPEIKRIACLDLTDGTHGNAVGIGQLDVITERLFQRIDFHATYTNLITSGGLEYAMVPMVAGTDQDLLLIAIAGAYCSLKTARIAIARDTSHLERLWLSNTLFDEADSGMLEVEQEAPLEFGTDGQLLTRIGNGWDTDRQGRG